MWLAKDYDGTYHLFEYKPEQSNYKYIPELNSEEYTSWDSDKGWRTAFKIADGNDLYYDLAWDQDPIEVNIADLFKYQDTALLSEQWADLCNRYLCKFLEKHEYNDNIEDIWIADDAGTVANIGDMFVSMDDIRYDIDNNIDEDKFEKWYWKNLDRYEAGLKFMNYPSFCKGAPDPISPKKEQEINDLRQRIKDARKLLDTEIENYKNVTGADYKGF